MASPHSLVAWTTSSFKPTVKGTSTSKAPSLPVVRLAAVVWLSMTVRLVLALEVPLRIGRALQGRLLQELVVGLQSIL